jgi:hypothetical protein
MGESLFGSLIYQRLEKANSINDLKAILREVMEEIDERELMREEICH